MIEQSGQVRGPWFAALAEMLEAAGWRYRRGIFPRCWQDPLNPDSELIGMEAAISRELRRERHPGEETGRALRREGLLRG